MFFDCVNNLLDINVAEIVSGVRFTNINNKTIIVEANTKIFIYNSQKIVLSLKKSKIYVLGDKLHIKHFDNNQVVIVGDIFSVSDREVNIV